MHASMGHWPDQCRPRTVCLTMKTLVAAMFCLVLAGCVAQRAHPVGVIEVRNESPQSVLIEVDGLPNGDQPMAWIPTWTVGWCPRAEIGFADDGIANALQQTRIMLSGPSVTEPTTFPGTAADIIKGGLGLTIDPAGTIQVTSGEVPLPSAGCALYPLDPAPR